MFHRTLRCALPALILMSCAATLLLSTDASTHAQRNRYKEPEEPVQHVKIAESSTPEKPVFTYSIGGRGDVVLFDLLELYAQATDVTIEIPANMRAAIANKSLVLVASSAVHEIDALTLVNATLVSENLVLVEVGGISTVLQITDAMTMARQVDSRDELDLAHDYEVVRYVRHLQYAQD